jgi:hypothetical protein
MTATRRLAAILAANTLGFVDELHKPAGSTEKRHQQWIEPTELNRLLGPPPYPPPRIPAPGSDTADHLLRHCPYFGAMFGRNGCHVFRPTATAYLKAELLLSRVVASGSH